MFNAFRFLRFKSFTEESLPTAPLTLVIGTNASGKSNAVDGMRTLSRMALNLDLPTLLDGARGAVSEIRGGSLGMPQHGKLAFGVICELRQGDQVYVYGISIAAAPRLMIINEDLHEIAANETLVLLEGSDKQYDSGDIQVQYYTSGKPAKARFLRHYSALSQVPGRLPAGAKGTARILAAAEAVATALRQMLFLDPIPQLMRTYVNRHRTQLAPNGENLSAVVAHLIQDPAIKHQILSLVQELPEQEIIDIGTIETPTGEVMLQLTERWGTRSVPVDARSLSDGTLRFLAILCALVGEPAGTTLVVEEIDNGLHPSRVGKLLGALRDIGVKRGIQVIATTHNPALLNALTKDDLAGVVICHRDPATGESRFTPWLEVGSYPALMARARIGDLMTAGKLEAAVHEADQPKEDAAQWLKEHRP